MQLKKNREGNMVSDTHRECTECKEVFAITSGMTLCGFCNSTRVKSMSPEWKMHQRAKQRAKNNGREFTIEVEDVSIPEHCPILGIKIGVNSGRSGAYDSSPSLDRMDNDKGYIPGNVWVISQKANAMKGSASREELILFAGWVMRETASTGCEIL